MANNVVQVKRTNVSGRTPNTTGSYVTNSQYISAGELALNMADGILYTSNGSAVIEIGANNSVLKSTSTITATGIVSGSELTSTLASGDEGGQINLAKPPNATTDGGVTIDAYQNKLRIFEQGGSARGVYIDLTAASAGVGTNLLAAAGSGTVTSVGSANGIAGGPITGTGTLYAVAGNSTVFVNASGIHVNTASLPSGGITSLATGNGLIGGTITTTGTVSILANTGIVANSTGAFVNATYIGTLTANNANNLNGQAASFYTNATNITTGTLPYAQIPANIVNTTGSFTLSGNTTLAGTNTVISSNVSVNATFGVSNSTANVLVVYSNGNVGIGTSSPASKLDLSGEINILTTNTGAPANPLVATIQSNTNFSSGLVVRKRGNTTDIDGSVANNAELGYHGFFGWDGTAYVRGAYVISRSTEDWNATSRGTKLSYFTTQNGTTTNVERLTLDQSGNVGIGNTAPNAKLQVTGTANVSGNVAIAGITTFNANVILDSSGLSANGGFGTAGQVLTSNGTSGSPYWSTISSSVNVAAQYSWTNTHSFAANVTFTGGIIANSSIGTSGQVLHSNGSTVYWAAATGGGYYKGGTSTVGTLAGGGQNIFRVNANTLNTNTTIAAGENAQATGPIAVASGIVLTVETGARVSIV